MTPEEAIRIIKEECYVSNLLDIDKTIFINTALDKAVEALKAEPCEDTITLTREAYSDLCLRAADYEARKAKPCEDCISRQAVNKLVDELARAISDEKCHIQRGRNYGRIMHDILKLPSVEPERKTGKWIHMVGWWECNQCHAEYTDMPTCMGKVIYEYCPMCGAKMEVEE